MNSMGFVKFGLNCGDHDGNDDIEANELNKTSKRKRKDDCETESTEKSRSKTKWADYSKRPKRNLDYNECKNDLSHLFYIKVRAQRLVRHPLVPNLNVGLNAIEDLMDLPNNMYPHCTMSELRPVYYAKKHCSNVDACFLRTIADDNYWKRLTRARKKYQSEWKASRQIRKLAKDNVYQTSLFTAAERLESHPDPFFYGNYDFYYTGGNLCTVPNAESHNVLHIDNTELGALKLSIYPHGDLEDLAVLQENTNTKLPTEEEVFEITSLQNMNGAQNLIAARQLNNITLLKIDSNESKMKTLIEFKTKHAPLISSAQSLEKPEVFVVSTMNQSLRVYDINRPKHVALKKQYKMLRENSTDFAVSWNRINRWQGETFLYANQYQLMFADFRAPQHDWFKTECTFSAKEYPCDFNNSIALSEFEHLFYIGTTHKLRCLDARYMTQQTHHEQISVCEWTHQLDYPPAFLDVYRDGAHEYIACASQLAGDLRICELTQSKHLESTSSECAFESHCLPWQPPTIQEAYDNAALMGIRLSPEICLKQRIRACTTGLQFLKTKSNPATQALLMYANSNGDVYAQSVKRRQEDVAEERTSARSDAIMEEFANKLTKIQQPALNHTDIVDMKALRSVFLCSQLNEKKIKLEAVETNTEQQPTDPKDSLFKRNKGRWRKSMWALRSYQDALVPDLLSIWDINCEEGPAIKYSTLKNTFKNEKSDSDILNWLNKSDETAPTTTIPFSNLNASMDMDLTGIAEQPHSTQILTSSMNISFLSNTSNFLNNSTLQNTSRMTPAKPKASKAKKKHVKGF